MGVEVLARGYKGRWLYDFLFWLWCLATITGVIVLCVIAYVIATIYWLILIPAGHFTFTRYDLDGYDMDDYSSKDDMLKRALIREEGLNPCASISEMKKSNEKPQGKKPEETTDET